jgi:hypothetical protein
MPRIALPVQLARKLAGMWITIDTAPIELLFSVVTSSWGLWLLLPFDSFSSRNFRVLAWIAPEEAWGLFALATAALRVYGVLADSKECRMGAAWLGFLIWTFVAYGIAFTDVRSTGVPVYAAYAAVSAFVAIRLKWARAAGEP